MVEKITVSLPDDTYERLHDRLEYGDNRSKWIAEAIDERIERLEAAEESDEGNQNTPATAD